MHGWDASPVCNSFNAQIEIGCVDTDQDSRWIGEQSLFDSALDF